MANRNCPACQASTKLEHSVCPRCCQSLRLPIRSRSSASGGAEIIGGIVGLALPFFGIIFLLSQCDRSSASLDEPAVAPVNMDDDLKVAKDRLDHAVDACENGASGGDPTGKYALAEVDIAMADSIDDVSPEQEWRIRKSIGAEMGLAPSEVDGWKDIYRSRAEQARRLLKERDDALQRTRVELCDAIPGLREKYEKLVDQ